MMSKEPSSRPADVDRSLGPVAGRARSVPNRREQDSMADLAAAAAAGDRGAFEAIHRRLSGGIHRLFLDRAAGKPEVADDLSQRTWLAAWDSLQKGRYDPARAAITTFVYAIGYKMWLQHLRTVSRPETLVPDVFDGAAADLQTPEYESHAAELLTAVRNCLKNQGDDSVLTEEERGIIRASAAGTSDRDIAKQLKIAASTLNARKQSAIEKIRRFLAGLGHRGHSTERD
jgi:RNA polymerase sigma factor (sigma-70 family)